MDILLRYVDTANGSQSYQDTEVKSKSLSIGSSKAVDIQLCGKDIALKHLVIITSGGKVTFDCKGKLRIALNGRAVSKGKLAVNDEIQLESHIIRVINAPAGFDVALEIRVDQDLQDRALESAYVTTIDGASWGTRWPAYAISFVLVVVFAAWPLYSHYYNTHNENATAAESKILGNAKSDISFIHSGDRYWSTGSLNQAHQLSIGDNCAACHQSPFEQVKDAACEECHEIADHIDPNSNLISASSHAKNSAQACQSCHKEHNEPTSVIIQSDMLCVDCHAEEVRNAGKNPHHTAGSMASVNGAIDDSVDGSLNASLNGSLDRSADGSVDGSLNSSADSSVSHSNEGNSSTVSDIASIPTTTGFSLDKHPQFKLSYLESVKLDSTEAEKTIVNMRWNKQQMAFDSAYPEASNLTFNHKVHFNPSKMRTTDKPDGMQCADCHILKSDKEHFEPISMEAHCSSCHQLTFDTDNLERQLPHGEPDEVIRMLEEHYVRVYTDPDFKPAGSSTRRRRLGQRRNDANCDTPFACGMQKAAREAEAQFIKGGCNYCHQVSDSEADSIYARWKVLPVRINDDWYPNAIFDHASHETKKADSNHSCLSCHDAEESESNTDVLIPGIDNCVDCHGDESIANKITVNCVSCHDFHPKMLRPSMPSMNTIDMPLTGKQL